MRLAMPTHRTLTDQELVALGEIGHVRRFRPSQVLFAEGDGSDHVVVITRGRVKISSLSKEGHETILAIRSTGDIVGEFAALDGRPRSASVRAMSEVEGLVVSGDRFRSFLQLHPTVAVALLSLVVGRIRESDQRRAEFGRQRVTVRVARLLFELVSSYGTPVADGSGTAIEVPLSQSELAGAVGASREAVARSLRHLRDDGVIATQRRRIVVMDLAALREVGTGPDVLP